jgi:hypothetical protein
MFAVPPSLPVGCESPSGSFALRASGALADPGKWVAFVAEANTASLAHTSHWLAGKDRLMRRQFAARQPDRPYSNGAIETVFDAITKRLWTRRFAFRNRARLELALRLMLLDVEGVADELRYREAIRMALLAAGGQPTRSRRSLDDRGGSSIHARGPGGDGPDGGDAGAEREPRAGLLQPQEDHEGQPRETQITASAPGFDVALTANLVRRPRSPCPRDLSWVNAKRAIGNGGECRTSAARLLLLKGGHQRVSVDTEHVDCVVVCVVADAGDPIGRCDRRQHALDRGEQARIDTTGRDRDAAWSKSELPLGQRPCFHDHDRLRAVEHDSKEARILLIGPLACPRQRRPIGET